jgi:alkanesulfonate monooxygenase SsuD/methylene tetrahydromethanopterin reductase-like flavin-dependent oxidoreductase (luciferase family)
MKYGLLIRRFSYQEIRDQALLADKYGFDSVHIDDHFYSFEPDGKQPYLDALVVMSAIAVETSRVKLGYSVLCNSYRNPALLAKMITSIDHMSQGRALLWIGAGWREEEYKAYGYPFPSAKERVDQYEEAITILKKLFTEEETNFDGKFWKLEKCLVFPKPVQKPYPQIVVGSQGIRMQTIACREADGVNMFEKREEDLKESVSFINKKLRKFGRDLSKFEISLQSPITLVRNEKEKDNMVDEIVKRNKDENLTKEKILKDRLIGTTDEIRERMRTLEQIGIKKLVTHVGGGPSIKDPLIPFYKEVISNHKQD